MKKSEGLCLIREHLELFFLQSGLHFGGRVFIVFQSTLEYLHSINIFYHCSVKG